MISYMAKRKLAGAKRYPLVLMLEPTHQCNLACNGCGRIREYHDTLTQQMSVAECLDAVEQCGAPVVSICGGEPLLYQPIADLVRELLERGKHIHLCSNGLLMAERLPEFQPSPSLIWSVHLDGPEKIHDAVVNRKGVYQRTIAAIRRAKQMGFSVCTNTTVYKESEPQELGRLFQELEAAGIDGLLVSPGYSFDAADPAQFLSKREVHEKFRTICAALSRHRCWNSPLYLKFLLGERDLYCTPWGSPCVNPQGWRSPCYLIADRHAPSFEALMRETDWERFERQEDPRCQDCMVHSGFEPAAVFQGGKHLGDIIDMLRWNLL
jgi:hopanoid biosynthesis associated radical SAM protein HpnH